MSFSMPADQEDSPRGASGPCGCGSSGRTPFRHVASEVGRRIEEVLAGGGDDFSSLQEFEDCVYIKNSRGVLVFSNESHRRFFSPGQTPIGRTAHTYLAADAADRAEKVESLILAGCPYVECEHTVAGPDGDLYQVRAQKRSLQALKAPGIAFFGVIRILNKDERGDAGAKLDLTAAAERFRGIGERDQEICRLTALGVSSRELGERLGMTTRGIELRKQKAFAQLGVAKAVDLARLLVRLQDQGHFDLGL